MMKYKIFRCSLCEEDNSCYCIIKEENTQIINSDIKGCLIGGISNWKEISINNYNKIINILQKL
jgi:hypothetical protein